MDEWNEEFLAVEVEREIEKHRRERESLTTGATGEKLGCGKMLLYFVLGILLIKGFGEIISIFFSN
jgi:hypothetical protein